MSKKKLRELNQVQRRALDAARDELMSSQARERDCRIILDDVRAALSACGYQTATPAVTVRNVIKRGQDDIVELRGKVRGLQDLLESSLKNELQFKKKCELLEALTNEKARR